MANNLLQKILIVEDEDLLSSAFTIILETDGYKVTVARDGSEALKAIPDFKPDLILLDLLMPRMGGVEFLEKYVPSVGIVPPIVVLSNLHDNEIITQVKKIGAKDYVVKSQMTPDKLSTLVKKYL